MTRKRSRQANVNEDFPMSARNPASALVKIARQGQHARDQGVNLGFGEDDCDLIRSIARVAVGQRPAPCRSSAAEAGGECRVIANGAENVAVQPRIAGLDPAGVKRERRNRGPRSRSACRNLRRSLV